MSSSVSGSPSSQKIQRSRGLMPPKFDYEQEEYDYGYERYGSPSDMDEDDMPQPDDLDEPWLYEFRAGDNVWIRTAGGKWLPGRVSGSSIRKRATREAKDGIFYPVIFGEFANMRKYFAPLNGEIKPDTAHIRWLLKNAGWLDDA